MLWLSGFPYRKGVLPGEHDEGIADRAGRRTPELLQIISTIVQLLIVNTRLEQISLRLSLAAGKGLSDAVLYANFRKP